ncbi:MAG TPA: hypothetical protein VGS57_19255 [Thermoanaerobaculia bacterium]|jgi:hypothetical protein|nr:hypothetical protein [Thermoanaerobaculia bacterium]
MSPAPGFNDDFVDLLRALLQSGVEFVVVGAHAMAVHGVPRATGDLDLVVRPTTENARRLVAALRAFGAPLEAHGVGERDFSSPGAVYQIGLPPRRIDLLTSLTGVSFDDAWAGRVEIHVADFTVPFLGRDALLHNKRATARDKDLADLQLLTRDEDSAK